MTHESGKLEYDRNIPPSLMYKAKKIEWLKGPEKRKPVHLHLKVKREKPAQKQYRGKLVAKLMDR